MSSPFTRRTFLKGLGVSMALPFLQSLAPRTLAASAAVAAKGAAAAAKAPVRMAFIYVPNGVNLSEWTPKEVGADFQLPYSLEPLRAYKNDLLVISGLAQDKGRN